MGLPRAGALKICLCFTHHTSACAILRPLACVPCANSVRHLTQRRLAESHICLINAGPTGSEALKNLVLPGCGRFTILDDSIVTEADLGNNFFVDQSYLGQPRAKAVQELLCEMNPDVIGNHNVATLSTILEREPAYFSQFSMVIATQVPDRELSALETLLRASRIPLVVGARCHVATAQVCSVYPCCCVPSLQIGRTYGLVGFVRLSAGEHTVVESKLEFFKEDLRISEPFPELAVRVLLCCLSSSSWRHATLSADGCPAGICRFH